MIGNAFSLLRWILAMAIFQSLPGIDANAQALTYGTAGPDSRSTTAPIDLEGPAYSNLADRISDQNKRTSSSVTDAAVRQSMQLLPKLTQLGSELKFGKHNVLSKDGDAVIGLIRASVSGPMNARQSSFKEIEQRAARGSPEAMTFLGFVAEHGLFGRAKNLREANELYSSAGRMNYQPALFNQALLLAYGRLGRPDLSASLKLIDRAADLAADNSHRVCGFAAFLHYRAGNQQTALRYASGCDSPLARLPSGLWNTSEPLSRRVDWLRSSIATGVDDGYKIIEKVTAEAPPENQFLHCKYAALNRTRAGDDRKALTAAAERCYEARTRSAPQSFQAPAKSAVVPAILAFAQSESATLEKNRLSNRFHFSWAVPYLPFGQAEVQLFESAILKGQR